MSEFGDIMYLYGNESMVDHFIVPFFQKEWSRDFTFKPQEKNTIEEAYGNCSGFCLTEFLNSDASMVSASECEEEDMDI